MTPTPPPPPTGVSPSTPVTVNVTNQPVAADAPKNQAVKVLEAAAAGAILAGLAVLSTQLGEHMVDGYAIGAAAIAGFVGKLIPDQLFS